METNAPEAQLPATRGDRHGRGAGISLGIAGFALVVLLVLPGFLAAGYSRMDPGLPGLTSVNGDVEWDVNVSYLADPGDFHAELMILAPSGWLMQHSQPMRRFYNWQYRVAGGLNINIV